MIRTILNKGLLLPQYKICAIYYMSPIPICFVCEKPASRVCQHPDCKEPSFFCSGPCVKGSSQKIHTHNDKLNWISCDVFYSMIANTENQQLSGTFKEHLEEANSRINNIKLFLDKAMKQHQHDLEVELKPQLVEGTKMLMKQLKGQKYSEIIGGNVSKFVKEGSVENCSVFMGNTRKYLVKQFDSMIEKIQNICEDIVPIRQRDKLGSDLYKVGNQLKAEKNWKEAIYKFIQGEKLRPYSDWNYFQMGYCYDMMQKYVEADFTYQKCLSLNPNHELALNNLGAIYHNITKEFDKAIEQYNKTLTLNPTYTLAYNNRGLAFMRLLRYQEALDDFSKACQLDKNNEQYQNNKNKAMKALAQQEIEASKLKKVNSAKK